MTSEFLDGVYRPFTEKLSPAVGHIYILPGTYGLPFDGTACLAQKDWQPRLISNISMCISRARDSRIPAVLAALNESVSSFKNVEILDLNPLICPKDQCAAHLNGEIVFRDSQHLAADYVQTLTPLIADEIAEIHEL